MRVVRQMFLLLVGVLVFGGNLEAYYDSKMVNNKEIVIIHNNDLFDKYFNPDTMLFSAVASDRAYDDDFELSNSANYELYKENGMQQITSYTVNDRINDIEASIAKKHSQNKTLIVISFRGTNFGKTDGINDIITDLNVKPVCGFSPWDNCSIKVHKGFFESEQLFEKGIKDNSIQFVKTKTESATTLFDIIKDANRTKSSSKNIQFLITGHSLGGAVATLFAARLIDHYNISPESIVVYTFGAPAAGNEHFKYVFEDNQDKSKVFKYFYRIRNFYDPVPLLTSARFVALMQLGGAAASLIVEKPKWAGALLKQKFWYEHIGELYVFDPGNTTLHYGNELNNDKYRMTYEKAVNNIAIFWHKLKDMYIPNIKTYTLYKNQYKYYCNNDLKKVDYDILKDALFGNLVTKKNEISKNFLAYKNINKKIGFYRVRVGKNDFCYEKILNRFYFNDNPKITFIDKTMPFSNLRYEQLFKDYYFNKKPRKSFIKLFSFLNDAKFMKAVDRINMGIAGPMDKNNVISFLNILKKEYPTIKLPTIFKENQESDLDFYNNKIFSAGSVYKGKAYSQYVNELEKDVLLSYFKAVNSNSKWIVDKNSHAYKFLIKKDIDPFYYYLYHIKRKLNVSVLPVKGYGKLFFLRQLYNLVIRTQK